MTSTGMRPSSDPNDPPDIGPRSDLDAVLDEEDIDAASVEEDLETEPEEKRNATDGYAPADKDVDTAELDELED